MTSERYEQVGWLHDKGRMFVSGIKALPEGQPQPEGWRPVFVRVEDPEPERCPTCGSAAPTYCTLGYTHIWRDGMCCPDPWHGGQR